jgi:hypothetical protein
VVEAPPFKWWVADSLVKIRPLDPLPDSPVRSAALYAGRNEFEPFQIVLRGDDKDVADIDIRVSDLRTTEGAEIPRSNVTVYFEQFLNITQPSVAGGSPGLWPDALVCDTSARPLSSAPEFFDNQASAIFGISA